MSSRVADRLAAVRRQRFVGRDDERALFRAALSSAEPPFNVLHVYGPGGVGKTTLLTEFLDLCEQAGVPAWRLDARNIDPAPASFLAALGAAIGAEGASPAEAIAERGGRQVILVDTYELLRPLDAWLREVLLPELSAQVVTVLAGREAPAPAWKTDWQSLVRSINLHNLDPDEARAYLARRRVPPEQHAAVLELTRGHPLALTLVADVIEQRAGRPFQLADAPDVIAALLERFVEKVPGPRHRIALETCALLRVTTEPLLAEVLRDEDAHDVWEWLRGLSFVESGPLGLFPHDLARDALSADLRWRNPDRFADLHARARAYYSRRLNETKGQEQQRVLSDYVFLHRDNPTFRPFLDWGDTGASLPTPPMPEDHPALRARVARHVG